MQTMLAKDRSNKGESHTKQHEDEARGEGVYTCWETATLGAKPEGNG